MLDVLMLLRGQARPHRDRGRIHQRVRRLHRGRRAVARPCEQRHGRPTGACSTSAGSCCAASALSCAQGSRWASLRRRAGPGSRRAGDARLRPGRSWTEPGPQSRHRRKLPGERGGLLPSGTLALLVRQRSTQPDHLQQGLRGLHHGRRRSGVRRCALRSERRGQEARATHRRRPNARRSRITTNSSRAALAAGKMVFSEGAGRLPQ